MLLIEKDIIYITRGDDAEFEVNVVDAEGELYTMVDGDELIFTVREIPDYESPVIFSVKSTSPSITLSHDDTENVDVGRYSADIELRTGGLRRTIWPMLSEGARYRVKNFRNFVVMPGVTQ